MDEVDRVARELPAKDVAPERAERIRRRALRVLARAGRPAWVQAADAIWDRAEPVLVAATVVVYLAWAIGSVTS